MGVVSNWTHTVREEITVFKGKKQIESEVELQDEILEDDLVEKEKPNKNDYWAIIASGAGLFSDGYVNNSISAVNVCLKRLYPVEMTKSTAISNVSSIVFAGTIMGQISFGYFADRFSRKICMLVSNVLLIVFALLCSLSWGYKGSVDGLLSALTAFRFFLGIGIGGEYPSGSVAAAEASSTVKSGNRNRWFIWFTNCMIDSGFVISSFVPLILLWIYTEENLGWVWRMTLGLGAVFPISLFYLRLKFEEHESFQKHNFKRTKPPYRLIFKYYGFRLFIVAFIWFNYNFSSYAFGIYSAPMIETFNPGGTNDLVKTFGYNTVLNLFLIPGCLIGALVSDYIGPRLTLTIGVYIQGVLGYVMAAVYPSMGNSIGGFVVLYGLFQTMGEFSCGDNIGLIASKTSSSAVRGQYYGIAAAVGKLGAFIGTYIFPYIQRAGGPEGSDGYMQAPFWVSSSICLLSGTLALFFLPPLTQDAITREDKEFVQYLADNGFDISLMGDLDVSTVDSEKILSEEDAYVIDDSLKIKE